MAIAYQPATPEEVTLVMSAFYAKDRIPTGFAVNLSWDPPVRRVVGGTPDPEELAAIAAGRYVKGAELDALAGRVDPGTAGTAGQSLRHGPTGPVWADDAVNVKAFGAVGDGVANDTAAFHAARDSGATMIDVPDGTYLASIALNVAGQTWTLSRGARIVAPAALGELGAAVSVTANDVGIVGPGSIDGSRANQSGSSVFAVYVTGDRFRWDGPAILSAKKHGLFIFGGTGHQVRNIATANTGQNGVHVTPNGKHMDDCVFANIVCDRSGATAGYEQGGFKILGNATYQVRRPAIRNVRGILPDPAVVASSTTMGNVPVEFWYIEDGQIDDVYGFGGWIGVSYGYACKRTATGKVTVEKAQSNGFEMAGVASATSGVFNSVGQVVVKGGGVTRRPVVLTHFDDLQIGSIVTTDAGYDDGVNLSRLLYAAQCDRVQIGSIAARMGSATGTGAGMYLETCSDVHVGTVVVEGGAGTELDAAIRLHGGVDGFTVGGGRVSGFPYDFRISASSAVTTDNVVVSGVRMGTGATLFSYSGGAIEGDNVRLLGCPGLVRNGKACDIVNRKLDLIRAWGTGSPEGVVTAGVGSEYMRTDGGPATAAYRKESGTGNVGWVAK